MARTFGPDLPPELQEKDEKSVVDKLPRKQVTFVVARFEIALSCRYKLSYLYKLCGTVSYSIILTICKFANAKSFAFR